MKSLTGAARKGWGFPSSFKQLTEIQQKQVGCIVGALVSDAAARRLDRCEEAVLSTLCQSAATTKDTLAFFPTWHSPVCRDGALAWNSFAGEGLNIMLRGMAASRGNLIDWQIAGRELTGLAATFPEEHRRVVEDEQASFPLFPVCCALPLAATYPYCDDEPLRAYASELVAFLSGSTAAGTEPGSHYVQHALPFVHSLLSVVLRCLQYNPDPVKNAAFRAVPGAAAIFPFSEQKFCPGDKAPARDTEPLCASTLNLRRALEIVNSAQSFEEGIGLCFESDTPGSLCERALVVGACLGAKYGARNIPAEWIDATHGHETICSFAIECSRWAWNPASG